MAPSPPLIVTTDLDGPHPVADPAAASPVTPQRHRRQDSELSDPTHLSPAAAHGVSLAGHSPSPSVSTALTPPSPTLSNASGGSVHFSDEATTPLSSPADNLAPIGEDGDLKTHKRDWSVGTWGSSVESEPSRDLSPMSAKPVNGDMHVDAEGNKVEAPPIEHIDPNKDNTDPTPFKEKPSRLAMLVDPKSLNDLEAVRLHCSAGLAWPGVSVAPHYPRPLMSQR